MGTGSATVSHALSVTRCAADCTRTGSRFEEVTQRKPPDKERQRAQVSYSAPSFHTVRSLLFGTPKIAA